MCGCSHINEKLRRDDAATNNMWCTSFAAPLKRGERTCHMQQSDAFRRVFCSRPAYARQFSTSTKLPLIRNENCTQSPIIEYHKYIYSYIYIVASSTTLFRIVYAWSRLIWVSGYYYYYIIRCVFPLSDLPLVFPKAIYLICARANSFCCGLLL